jgi:hypothetical protein
MFSPYIFKRINYGATDAVSALAGMGMPFGGGVGRQLNNAPVQNLPSYQPQFDFQKLQEQNNLRRNLLLQFLQSQNGMALNDFQPLIPFIRIPQNIKPPVATQPQKA